MEFTIGSRIKNWLARRLSDRTYQQLADIKNRVIPDLLYRVTLGPFWLVIPVFKLLPDKVLIALKSNINIFRPMDYEKGKIFLSVESEFEYRVRLKSASKEPETIQWIEEFFNNGDVFYDIGANVGAYSLVVAKMFNGDVKVYAFEPAFQNYSQLCKNVIKNSFQGTVTTFPIALCESTGLRSFNYRSLAYGTAVHSLGEALDSEGQEFTPVAVQSLLSYRLDDLLDHLSLPVPDHIKIDVDGTEYAVLKGMDSTLSNKSVRSMMLEINEGTGDGNSILHFLRKKGFHLYARYRQNFLLIRKGYNNE